MSWECWSSTDSLVLTRRSSGTNWRSSERRSMARTLPPLQHVGADARPEPARRAPPRVLERVVQRSRRVRTVQALAVGDEHVRGREARERARGREPPERMDAQPLIRRAVVLGGPE